MALPPQQPDDPIGFGFKNTWWALPTAETAEVAVAIGLQQAQAANWQTGIKYAYDRRVFVTPPIKGWTLVVGFDLPPKSQNARSETIEPLEELSTTFGEAQVFATHRVVEYQLWAKAVAGSLTRAYGYVGESGQTFWDEGPATPGEQELGFAFFDERCPAAADDAYWEREGLDYPDEMSVMDIARVWSVSPYDLDDCRPAERQLGILGTRADRLQFAG